MVIRAPRIVSIALTLLLTVVLLAAEANFAQASSPAPESFAPSGAQPAAGVLAPDWYGSLQVTKLVFWNGVSPETGKTFSICIQGPSFTTPSCKTFTYPNDLVQTWSGIIAGQYTISENYPGAEWTKYIPVPTVTVTTGQTAYATVKNFRNTGTVNVKKVVLGNPPNPLQVFSVCLTGPSPSTAKTCQDIKGGETKSWSGLVPGDYTISEVNPGVAWDVSIDHPTVRVNADGTTNYLISGSITPLCTETIITNTYKATGKIDVKKIVNWSGATPDPTKTFRICLSGPSFPSGPDCKTFFGGEEKSWTGLVPGVYTISEDNPGSEWSVTIDHPTIQVNADGTLTWLSPGQIEVMCYGATVTNTLKPGSLKVTKIVNWAGFDPVPGQSFEICIQGPSFPNYPGDCKQFTYPDGLVQTWTNLTPGSYTVTETNGGGVWTVTVPPGPVTVGPGPDPAEASVTNTHKAKIEIVTTPNPVRDFIGAILNDSAVLSGGNNPGGKITFKLFPPTDVVCIGTPVFTQDVNVDHGNGSYATNSTFASNMAGTWNWTADYSGDANNAPVSSPCKSEMVTIDQARPALDTVPQPGTGTVGDYLNDTANLSGGYSPTGSILFSLYPPSDAVCAGTPVFTETVPVGHGNGAYSTTPPGFGSNATGTWRWTAGYSGDANNAPAFSGCTAELVTIERFPATISTIPNPAAGIVGDVLNDSATLTGYASPTGTITFKLFPPSDTVCAGPASYTQAVPVNGNGVYQTTPGFVSNQIGTWRWTSDYGGDANNKPASSGCTEEPVTISFKPGSILVQKHVDWSGVTPVAGQTFEICLAGPAPSTASTCKVFTPEQTQSWDNLAPGTYTVSETDPGSAWITAIVPTTVVVSPDGKPSVDLVTVTNTRKLGHLKVTKTVDWNGIPPVSGTTFSICVQGPSFPTTPDCKTFTYPNDLVKTWDNLIPGSYTVTEPGSGTTWDVVVTGSPAAVPDDGGTVSVTVANKAKLATGLQVTKVVNWNGADPVNGTTFSICISGPSFPTTPDCKTFTYPDTLTQTWSNLVPGNYTLTEPGAGSQWTVNLPAAPVPVTLVELAKATVTNTRKLGSLEVTKTVDWNGVTPDPVASFEICITGPSYPSAPNCKTFNASNGWTQAWTGLIPGSYTLTETSPGSQWQVTVPTGAVIVPVDGGKATAQVTNQRKHGSLAVTKTVEWNGVTPVTGQTFTICLTGPSYPVTPNCKTFTYPSQLTQTWTDLIPGTYSLSEQNTGSEWDVLVTTRPIVVPIDGGTGQAQVTNTRKHGSLQVVKTVDWKGVTPDPTVVFHICVQGPSYPQSPSCKDFSNAAGWTQTWTDLIPGDYTVSEANAGAQWLVSVPTGPVAVPIDGGQASAGVTNTLNFGGLIVIKSVDWGIAVPDPQKQYEICVTGPSFPSPSCKFASYLGSTLTWNNLIPGRYDVTETDPGLNWDVTIPDTPGFVRGGGYTTIHVKNRYEEPTGVSLVSFNAALLPDRSVKLQWLMAAENNSVGYKIYRTRGGTFNADQLAGVVAAQGDGSSYLFTDAPPGIGMWTYWLVNVDTNSTGTIIHHVTVLVGDNWTFVPVVNK